MNSIQYRFPDRDSSRGRPDTHRQPARRESRKSHRSDPKIDLISSGYGRDLTQLSTIGAVNVLQWTARGRTSMMGHLRSTMQTLGATAALTCALSLAGPSVSHAAPSNLSGTDYVSRQPCNDLCKAYLAWSDRVSAMFHPSRRVARTAVHHGKPAGRMVHQRAPKAPPPSLNSFAQFPVRSDATPQSAGTTRAEVALSRPVDRIADRFPAADGFVTAGLAGTGSATNDVRESTFVSATDAFPAMQGASTIDDTAGGQDMRFWVSLLLAFCAMSALVFWGWSRGRTQTTSAIHELRIMGSKSELLRALVAASSATTAGFGVPSFVPKWRARRDFELLTPRFVV